MAKVPRERGTDKPIGEDIYLIPDFTTEILLRLLFLARLEWSYVCEGGSDTTRMFATRLENNKKNSIWKINI